ncbi:MAG: hypothetical protein H5T84_00090, partial [Thermoleophilia bacterium]|nr:hypothetical protein [Thermoleophilia bacterium]
KAAQSSFIDLPDEPGFAAKTTGKRTGEVLGERGLPTPEQVAEAGNVV